MDQYEKFKLQIDELEILNEEQANLITELTEENEKLKHWNEWLESTRTYKVYFGKEMVQQFCVTDEVYNQITKQVCEEIKARLKADPTIAEDYFAVVKHIEQVEKGDEK